MKVSKEAFLFMYKVYVLKKKDSLLRQKQQKGTGVPKILPLQLTQAMGWQDFYLNNFAPV
jgi:hypothetical protein